MRSKWLSLGALSCFHRDLRILKGEHMIGINNNPVSPAFAPTGLVNESTSILCPVGRSAG